MGIYFRGLWGEAHDCKNGGKPPHEEYVIRLNALRSNDCDYFVTIICRR